MKKIFLSLVAFTCIAGIADAQKVTFAVSAGVANANTFVKDDSLKVAGIGAKNGFTGGVSATIPFSKLFNFQPAVNFVQKGCKNEKDKSSLTLNYIEVPLLLVFKTRNKDDGDKKADDFFFGIGPTVAFCTAGEYKYKTDSGTVTGKVKFGNNRYNDDLRRVDVGANIMMGCLFFNNFFFSANYNIGFMDLSPAKKFRYRNNYLGFKVGYSFSNGKK